MSKTPYDSVRDDFRTHFQRTYGGKGASFEKAEAAYQYGFESASSRQYAGKSYSQSLSGLREGFDRIIADTPFLSYEKAVQFAFESAR